MSSRLVLYGAVSTLGAAAVIGTALQSRANFFAAAVAVGRSSGALMVLANFGVFMTICFGIVVKTIFFGQLRSIEYEHLFERLWIFLTESLLALTIFRDDFSSPFALTYGVLLFLKSFHWITADRVDYMDQVPPPGPPITFHIRCALIIAILTIIDIALVIYSFESILLDGVSAMVLFASEFMILLASIGGTTARYVVGLIDLRRARGRADAPSWEEKSMYLFYVDLAVDFAKLLTYLSFFLVILLHYGLPLHILRDVYMTLRSFLSRCSDLVRYRKATRDMDSQYPNASSEEMERNGDRTCIICREEMIARDAANAVPGSDAAGAGGPNETPKRLQCGHIFHFHCLRSWLERQQSCPTCRRDVFRPPTGPQRRPNGVNVQINPPPPPAPAARLQPNGVPAHNPIQTIYDQYFRPPEAQRPPAPTPTAPPAPASGQPTEQAIPNGVAGPSAPPVQAGGAARMPDSADADQRELQRGIWGGPIVPGRFFASPLGAAPQWPPSGSTLPMNTAALPGGGRTRSGGANMPVLRLPDPTADTAPAAAGPSTRSMPSTGEQLPSGIGIQSAELASPSATPSGNVTPSTSNPPQIFTNRTPSPDAPGHEGPGDTIEEDADDDAPVVHDEAAARRAAADAAMRRMRASASVGLKRKDEVSKEKGALTSDVGVIGHERLAGSIDKGKAKAPAVVDPLGEESRFIPYLTTHDRGTGASNGLPNGWSTPRRPGWGRTPSRGGIEGTEEALEERLRLLRDVDEVVWGLVGELTRAKSEWEADRASGSADTSGLGSDIS